jgi:hypothetical protein
MLMMSGVAFYRTWSSGARWWAMVLLGLQSIALRVWWYIPDAGTGRTIPEGTIPILTIPGDDFDFLLLHPQFGSYLINGYVFLQYALLFVITWLILREARFDRADRKSV